MPSGLRHRRTSRSDEFAAGSSMIQTRRAALAQGVVRFSLAANAEHVCAEIMLKHQPKARWRFILISSRFWLTLPGGDQLENFGRRPPLSLGRQILLWRNLGAALLVAD